MCNSCKVDNKQKQALTNAQRIGCDVKALRDLAELSFINLRNILSQMNALLGDIDNAIPDAGIDLSKAIEDYKATVRKRIALLNREAPADSDDEEDENLLFLKSFECPRGHKWQVEDTSLCDDRCPTCDIACSPYAYEDAN